MEFTTVTAAQHFFPWFIR